MIIYKLTTLFIHQYTRKNQAKSDFEAFVSSIFIKLQFKCIAWSTVVRYCAISFWLPVTISLHYYLAHCTEWHGNAWNGSDKRFSVSDTKRKPRCEIYEEVEDERSMKIPQDNNAHSNYCFWSICVTGTVHFHWFSSLTSVCGWKI